MKQLCKKRILQSQQSFSSLGDITSRSQFGGYSIAANKTIFGLVSEGELYLRASKKDEKYFQRRDMPNLIYTKRGMPVPLNYFLVDEAYGKKLISYCISPIWRWAGRSMIKQSEIPTGG